MCVHLFIPGIFKERRFEMPPVKITASWEVHLKLNLAFQINGMTHTG
jgi:hypothetical protein